MATPKTNELLELLNSSVEKTQIEAKLHEFRQHYTQNLTALIQNTDMIAQVSEWLKSNINSPLCSTLFKFIIRLYETMGFNRFSDINEYYRCHERIFNRDPKFLSKAYLEGYDLSGKSKELLIDNPLLNFTALHVTLSVVANLVKNPDIKKYKPTIHILTTLISLYCYDSNDVYDHRERADHPASRAYT